MHRSTRDRETPRLCRDHISLQQEAIEGFTSLLKQAGIVTVGLVIVLVATGGKPSKSVMNWTFGIGVAGVAYLENSRLAKMRKPGQKSSSSTAIQDEPNEDDLDVDQAESIDTPQPADAEVGDSCFKTIVLISYSIK